MVGARRLGGEAIQPLAAGVVCPEVLRNARHAGAWRRATSCGAALKVRHATNDLPAALVVDDDAAIRESLHQLLEDEGYAVTLAADGVDALEALRSASDRMVVLLDVMMPRLDGHGVLRAVMADPRLASQHRFVVMSASISALSGPLLPLIQEVGASTLIKPFSIDQLLTALSDAASQLTH